MGTLFTAIGFGIGGIIACGMKELKKNTEVIFCICAGLILGLLSFEVVPEAIEIGNWITFILGFLAGVLLFNILHGYSKFHMVRVKSRDKRIALSTGVIFLIGISIHNIPIGISLGAAQEFELSSALLYTILLHNIPEGLIVFTLWPDLKKRTVPIITLVISLPVGAGAYVGSKLGMGDPYLWSMFLSLSIGMIYMVTIKEILVGSIQEFRSTHVFLLTLLGFCFIGLYFAIL